MWHIWGKGEMRVGFWYRELRERDHLKDIGVGVRIILKKLTLKISIWRVQTTLLWLRIGTSGRLL